MKLNTIFLGVIAGALVIPQVAPTITAGAKAAHSSTTEFISRTTRSFKADGVIAEAIEKQCSRQGRIRAHQAAVQRWSAGWGGSYHTDKGYIPIPPAEPKPIAEGEPTCISRVTGLRSQYIQTGII